MLFNSQAFVLGFLPAVLAAYYLVRTLAWRQAVLVVASLGFYAAWDWRFVPALVGLTLANWVVVRVWAGGLRGVVARGVVAPGVEVEAEPVLQPVVRHSGGRKAQRRKAGARRGKARKPAGGRKAVTGKAVTGKARAAGGRGIWKSAAARVAAWRAAPGRAGGRGWVLWVGVGLNLGVLGVCKYADFVGANVAAALGVGFVPLGIILPLGVSFFTFQKISYLVDLRRGDRHVYGLLEFFAFVTFFPQLIAGPIVRHDELIPQFAGDPRLGAAWENLSRGGLLFVIGFAKKAGIADTAALTVDPLFAQAGVGAVGAAAAWAAAGAYALQIYFDFSGYSDMAIGLARMMGLRLPENFDAPYRATSVRDFWRRWHMTLSRFLRDYVYVPLGGNRGRGWRGPGVTVVLTMLLGGLWHGAAWTFVAWGGVHGVALAVNGAFARRGVRVPALVGWGGTLLFVVGAWVLFRSPDFGTALRVYAGMLGLEGVGRARIEAAPVLALGVAAALLGPTSQVAAAMALPRLWVAGVAGAALAGLLLLTGGRIPNEFIYFQF